MHRAALDGYESEKYSKIRIMQYAR
jgi:hypothetical protein